MKYGLYVKAFDNVADKLHINTRIQLFLPKNSTVKRFTELSKGT